MNYELKVRRKQAYLMNIWDDVNLPYTINNENIAEQVIHFFETESELIYPAKSYFVAIIYSYCLAKYFNIPLLESLNDEELLPDDGFFVVYRNDTKTYNKILKNIDIKNIFNLKSTQKTIGYFKREFLIKD